VRLFVAVAFDANVKAQITALQAQLRLFGISFTVTAATLFESRRDNERLWYKSLYKATLSKDQ
jgi:2'-5' RNA ligase